MILFFDQRSNWFWPHESKTQYSTQLSKLLNIILPRIMAPVMTKKRGALLSLQISLFIFLTPIINNALLNIKPIRQKYFLLVLLLMLSCLYCKPSWYIAGKRPSSLYSYSIIHIREHEFYCLGHLGCTRWFFLVSLSNFWE